MKLAVVLVGLVAWSSVATAEPMRFRMTTDERYISANGDLTTGSGQAFADYVTKRFTRRPSSPVTVVLNSDGGNMGGALALGNVIRALGWNTVVGRVRFRSDNSYEVHSGVCASACAYAFLGGVVRSLRPNDKLGVHKLRPPTEDAKPESHAEAAVREYLGRMGVQPDFVGFAQTIDYRTMHWLSADELRHWRIVAR